jgi:hypothetical protein
MKDFEDECDKNDEFRAKLKGKKWFLISLINF